MFITGARADYCVYFSPRNNKWRKLKRPKYNYSRLSQSGEIMTTTKYGINVA